MNPTFLAANAIRTKHKVLGRKRVQELRNAQDPILVAPLGVGTYQILDGRHRFEAMLEGGITKIPVRIYER